jgi:hypothetical protein
MENCFQKAAERIMGGIGSERERGFGVFAEYEGLEPPADLFRGVNA